MHGGLLGDVTPGKLFKSLDECLFAMAPGRISGIVESELGFHILLCEAVQAARDLPLAHVRPVVRQQLEARRKRLCQQAWIKSLRAGPALT
jgi:parvulin-like peptidyl-prolyl isomerase